MGKRVLNKNVIAVIKGDKGDAATIQVGEVKTLPAGEPATVENIGNSRAAVFNFGIPKGDGLAIKKWYSSEEEMNADSENIELGDIVGIEGTLVLYEKEEDGLVSKGSIKGEQGEPGLPGEAGSDGTTFTPAINSEGVLSWTNDGGKENPPSQTIKGSDGAAALVYGKIRENSIVPQVGGVTNFTEGSDNPPSYFNRTPVVGDIFLLMQYRPSTGQSFITICKITDNTSYPVGETIYVIETTGKSGVDGVTFTPTITEGVLSWTNNGDQENPPALNLKQLTDEQVTLLTFIAQNAQVVDNKIVFGVEVQAPSFNAQTE